MLWATAGVEGADVNETQKSDLETNEDTQSEDTHASARVSAWFGD